jgi:hypothetical protein
MGASGFARPHWIQATALVLVSAATITVWAQSQPKFPVMPPTPQSPATASPSTSAAPGSGGVAAGATPAAPAPGGARDPFEPLVRKPEAGEERKIQEVANLKLVGVVWDAKDSGAIRALVETPDGLGYYLRLNDEKFGGKVVAVERDRVRFVLQEQVPGAGSRERTVELKLPKPDGQ